MTRLFFALLTLFFLSGPAIGENSDFRCCTVAANQLTRAGYVSEVGAIKDFANSARAAGQSAEATARMAVAERNALKVKYRELSPADFVKQAEARNIEKYGNPLGPTVDQLRAQGKSWEEIIDAAARSGGVDMGL